MPPSTLGKRKRISRVDISRESRSPSPSSWSEASDAGEQDIQAIFQRAFEAKFAPLPSEPKKQKPIEEKEPEPEPEEDEESDWSGISSSDDERSKVEVVSYAQPSLIHEKASRAETRAFMSSKPPKAPTTLATRTSRSKADDADAGADEALHLKNDLALQRLLRDSHLLSATAASATATAGSSSSAHPLALTGALRHKSTDLHLLSLGAKTSIHHQKNMPLPERRANKLKARLVEAKRRAEAKENGIVLEKEERKRVGGKAKRERGVGGAVVGRFKGGTLVLSKRDVASITGGGRGKGGKRRGGRR